MRQRSSSAGSLEFRHSLDRLAADMQARARAFPVEAARALTWTAARVYQAERAEIQRAFDRPTRWTQNAPEYKPATPQNLSTVVQLKDDGTGGRFAYNYLEPQIDGGTRPQKRFEKLLQDANVLPAGWFAIPGNGARLDRFGNMRPSQIVEVLSAFRAFQQEGSSMNRTSRSVKTRKNTKRRLKDYFVSHPNATMKARNGGRLPWGVYERKRNGEIVTVLRFRPRVTYRKRLRWYEVAEATIAKWKDRHMGAALARAFGPVRSTAPRAA